MRWSGLAEDRSGEAQQEDMLPLTSARLSAARRVDPPDFRDVTFWEVHARSVLNKMPEASRMPFRWTVNPYRGCTHACLYCFARNTHTFLDLDPGHDFDSQIVVKVNAAEVLRHELAAPKWQREHVALGTNVDPYQRAEGRYRLMPGIVQALVDFGTPFSILTKGTLLLRDLPLLRHAAATVPVSVNVSLGVHDRSLWQEVEPGTPSPAARLRMCGTLADAGLPPGVMIAPVLPFLTDTPEQLETAVRAAADAGAKSVSGIVLHLRPGAREWYMHWLERTHPDLVPRYRQLYRAGSYADGAYQSRIGALIDDLAQRHDISRRRTQDDQALARAKAAHPAGRGLRLL